MLETLAWTLVHSLWQGLAVGAVAAIALSTVPHKPRVRHAIAMLALLTQFAVSIATAVSGLTTPIPSPILVEGTRILRAVANPVWMQWIVVAWAVGVLVMASRLALAIRASRSVRQQVQALPQDVSSVVSALAQQLKLSNVHAALSEAVVGPQVVGVLHPVLLIPTATLLQLSPEQLRAVLAHELAHLLHHDPLTQAAQEAVAMLFFYHPVTWWLTQVARQSREHACDDVAAQIVSMKAIATALFELETHRVDALALAASGELASRIQRLVQPPRRHQPNLAGGFAAAAVALMVAAPALASDRQAERAFRELERRTEVLISLSIEAPDGADSEETDEALHAAAKEKADALKAVVEASADLVVHGSNEWNAAGFTLVGTAYEDMAVKTVESTIPTYLNAEQVDAYRTALSDQASAMLEIAQSGYESAIGQGHDSEWTAEAERRLVAMDALRERLTYVPTPSPPGNPVQYNADLLTAQTQVTAFQQRCGAEPELDMLMEQLRSVATVKDLNELGEWQESLTQFIALTTATSACEEDE